MLPLLHPTQEDMKDYCHERVTYSITHLISNVDLKEMVRDLNLSKNRDKIFHQGRED